MRTIVVLLGGVTLLVLQASCRTNARAHADGAPPDPVTLTSARGPELPTLKARMRDHDRHGAAMRDAVARASLDDARREGKVLAELRIEGGIEPSWRKHLDAMNAAAQTVADAKDLTGASVGLAAVARACGDCHASLGGPGPVVGDPPGEGSGVGIRMARHQWAAARLWDGLAVPSEDAWKAGARVLTDAPLEPDTLTPGKSPAPAIGGLASAVHDLGRRARAVETAVDRGAVFGELMATCGACHNRLGGGPTEAKRR